MKRVALLIVLPFWYFALAIPQTHFAAQFGPFSTQTQCEDAAALFTTSSGSGLPLQHNPFFLTHAVTVACWSDS